MAKSKRSVSTVVARDVVEEHYQRIEPIQRAIVPDRQAKKRWYGVHQFFTRRAWNVVQAYIENFAPVKGAMVLDPFGGSGVTAVEAAILGRKGISYDINPFAVFYARCAGSYYAHPLDPAKSELRPKMLEVVDAYTARYPHPTKQLADAEYLARAKQIGIPTKRILDDRITYKTYELHTSRQLHDLALLKRCILELEYENPLTRDLLLFVLSATISKCNRTFVSAHGRKASRGGARIFSSYAMNLPPHPIEIEVFPEFQRKFAKLLQAKQEIFLELSKVQAKPHLTLDYCAVQDLGTKVDPETADYIFTDPPYGKLIPYMDLSSFFCDWLDLTITEEMRNKDIIENTSVHRSKEFYYKGMAVAFERMYETLRYDRWMTLVYAHKNTEYWDAIISACADAGFEFSNAVYEKPDVIWSLTKKKNKATTFSGELYLNFHKARSTKGRMIHIFKHDFRRIIQNTVELAIVHNDGCATLEDIYGELVPVLARYGLSGRFKQEKIDIKDYLEQDFVYNERLHGYELPPDRKLSSFIPIAERVIFYVRDFLISRKDTPSSFDDVVANVLPSLVNGNIPSRDSILDVLSKIAVRDVDGNWLLSDDEEGTQIDLPIPLGSGLPRQPPKTSKHNVLLWRLLYLGSKASMVPFLGKNEQRDPTIIETGIPFITKLKSQMTRPQRAKIEQIDVIWTKDGEIQYAFEIEESTAITTAFERFSKLMEVAPSVAENRRMVIVIPSRRRRKLADVFENSVYVGKPLYFENKIRVMFPEDVEELFSGSQEHYLKITELESKLKKFEDL